MASAQQVWELSRAFLADRPGVVAVLRAYLDESGTHEGSPVLTVAAYTAKPQVWRDWTRRWNAAKRPIKVYHAVDAANLEGEFKGWEKEDMNALAARMLPVIANHEITGFVAGLEIKAFEEGLKDYPHLRKLVGTPYAACFHWLVGKIVRQQNDLHASERIAFFHEFNDYRSEALESFNWIQKNVNQQRDITLAFGTKDQYVPLQAADILAYEGNKRLRNIKRPPRRAWEALKPHLRIHVGVFNQSNMHELVKFLSGMHAQLSTFGSGAVQGPYWGWRKRV